MTAPGQWPNWLEHGFAWTIDDTDVEVYWQRRLAPST